MLGAVKAALAAVALVPHQDILQFSVNTKCNDPLRLNVTAKRMNLSRNPV
jgi:hypothetical protein